MYIFNAGFPRRTPFADARPSPAFLTSSAADMLEQAGQSRGIPVMWLAAAFQAGVVYFSLRQGNHVFAAFGVALGGLFALLAWRGEPVRGTGRARLMWALVALSGILIAAAFAST
jgi:hypothetical protein